MALEASDEDPGYPTALELSYDAFELHTYVAVERYEVTPGRVVLYLDDGSHSRLYGVAQVELTFPPGLVNDLRQLEAALLTSTGLAPQDALTARRV